MTLILNAVIHHFLSTYSHKYKHDDISQEVDWYIHKAMNTYTKHNNAALPEYSKTSMQRPHILNCLELYDSKAYQDEVKRIVRKYCKECK